MTYSMPPSCGGGAQPSKLELALGHATRATALKGETRFCDGKLKSKITIDAALRIRPSSKLRDLNRPDSEVISCNTQKAPLLSRESQHSILPFKTTLSARRMW